jgi:hypothetical protein
VFSPLNSSSIEKINSDSAKIQFKLGTFEISQSLSTGKDKIIDDVIDDSKSKVRFRKDYRLILTLSNIDLRF